VVTSLALSFTNDDFEIERAALANALDLDHGDLLGQNRRMAAHPGPGPKHGRKHSGRKAGVNAGQVASIKHPATSGGLQEACDGSTSLEERLE
jgi:hypothetical protein